MTVGARLSIAGPGGDPTRGGAGRGSSPLGRGGLAALGAKPPSGVGSIGSEGAGFRREGGAARPGGGNAIGAVGGRGAGAAVAGGIAGAGGGSEMGEGTCEKLGASIATVSNSSPSAPPSS